jgi:hypothetical protein
MVLILGLLCLCAVPKVWAGAGEELSAQLDSTFSIEGQVKFDKAFFIEYKGEPVYILSTDNACNSELKKLQEGQMVKVIGTLKRSDPPTNVNLELTKYVSGFYIDATQIMEMEKQ